LLAAASPTELREAQLSTSYIWGNLMWSTDPATAVVEYGKVFRLDQGFRDIRKKYYDSNITLAKGALSRGDRIGAQRNLNAAREADPNGPELNDLFKSLTPTTG
jgi:hypothetical protein